MILDKQDATHVSVCIVGSGIGGSTLALKLASKNISFIIIEAGGLDTCNSDIQMENIGRKMGLRSTRSIQLGGTSNLWHGVLSPLDKIDFEKRDWIPNSGWAITLNDLNPFYKEAANIFNVKDYDYFNASKVSIDLYKKIDDMRFNRDNFKNKLFQQPLPTKNFKNDILELVKDSKNSHLLLNAVALEFVKNGDKVSSLKCGNDSGIFEIKADYFVSAAGALESPRLLLNSKIKNSNIGKYLMDHPMTSLCQIQPQYIQNTHIYSAIRYVPSVVIKTGIVLKDSVQRSLKLPNHNFFMRPSFTKGINNGLEKIKLSLLTFKDGKFKLKDLWKVLTSLNIIYQVLIYRFSLDTKYKYVDLFSVTEQFPMPESNVSLSNKKDKWGYPISKVNWQVSEQEILLIKKWYDFIQSGCFSKDDFKITSEFNKESWIGDFTSAAHHVGTARMGETSKTGVVDKNLKVFDCDNLYVCDGSVFTTSGNVNCGFTIAAFACRLADFIVHKKNIATNERADDD